MIVGGETMENRTLRQAWLGTTRFPLRRIHVKRQRMKMMRPIILSLVTLTSLGALLCGCASGGKHKTVGTSDSFHGPVGLQLYSLRADFATNVPSTILLVRGLGFRDVELAGTYGMAPEQFRTMLVSNGLVPIAAHFPYDRFKTNVDGVILEAKALGLKYAGVAWIPHDGDFDERKCLEAIEVFNNAGKALAAHGIKFFYHNHGYEFQPYGNGNRTLFDLMMAETNPNYVSYEMDVLWVQHPGQDPVKLLQKYGSRWALMHIKDLKKGVKTGELTGSTDVRNDVALGTGQIDLAATLKAAQAAGVKYYFIEDESPSVQQQLPLSLRYLEGLQW